MPQDWICFCEKCLQTHPDGKVVSRRTYVRHRAPFHSRPRKCTKRFLCRCSGHPNGHYYLCKRSYDRHLETLRDAQLLDHNQEAFGNFSACDSGNNTFDNDDDDDDIPEETSTAVEEAIFTSEIDSEVDVASDGGDEDTQGNSSSTELPNVNHDLGNHLEL